LPRSAREGRPRGRASTGDLSRIGVKDRRLVEASGAPYLVPGALALAAALGFAREGVMRSRNFERGRRVDVVMLGVLRDEWE
jgi:hypothetical protein